MKTKNIFITSLLLVGMMTIGANLHAQEGSGQPPPAEQAQPVTPNVEDKEASAGSAADEVKAWKEECQKEHKNGSRCHKEVMMKCQEKHSKAECKKMLHGKGKKHKKS